MERVFDYEDILNEKKVKLIALKLRKCASMLWVNIVAKRPRKGKAKIRSWDQIRDKLAKFLPSYYFKTTISNFTISIKVRVGRVYAGV